MAENNDTRNVSAPEAPKARRPLLGSEDGMFVDGVLLGSDEVIRLAEMPPVERRQWLAARRGDNVKASKFEEGVFVDGMLLGSDEVVRLAEMPLAERKQWLATRCVDSGKACKAVVSYMAALQVSLGELIRYLQHGVAG